MFTKMKFLPLITIFMFIFGCGEKIPIREMTLARMEITNALSVRAEKYAPDEIGEAKKLLIESHDFIKEDALDKAKTSADKSYEKAVEAYNKSLPLLAQDTLAIAEESLEKAIEAYAEVLAEKEFIKADESFSQAKKLYEMEQFYPCYETALEADQLAKNARNAAIGRKDILASAILEVNTTLDEAMTYNADRYAGEKLLAAEENLIIAEESLKSLELKKGFGAVEVASLNADEAYLLALKGTAEDRFNEAENLYNEAEGSDGAELAAEELNASGEALDQSQQLIEDEKYKESILSSDESMRLSMIVLNAMNELAKEKIANAEIVYYQATISEGASIAVDELAGAKKALDNSKSLVGESKGKEAIEQAAEAERLSYIVINTKAAAAGKTADAGAGKKDVTDQDYYIYKVRYIPERRDCLWRIAEKYYEDGLLWKNIYQENTDQIYNPDLIWPDMLIKVPKLDKKQSKEKNKAPRPETEALPSSHANSEDNELTE